MENNTRGISVLIVQGDIINTALLNKGIITEEELEKVRREYIDKMKIVNPKNYESYRKILLKMGIDIERSNTYKPTLKDFTDGSYLEKSGIIKKNKYERKN